MLEALQGKGSSFPPIWFMRQAGRYLPEYREIRKSVKDFLELCFDVEKATEVTLQPIRRFGFDASIIFSDILVIPYALGMDVAFKEKEGPVLGALTSLKNVEALAWDAKKLSAVYQAVERTRSLLPAQVPLIGFAGAPWTLASYMLEGGSSRNFLKAKHFLYTQKEATAALFALLEQSIIAHLSAQITAGAQIVQIFDSWAGALYADELEHYSITPLKRIVQAIKQRHPKIPVIVFLKGVGMHYAQAAQVIPADAFSLDMAISLDWAKQTMGKVCLQGNLDPVLLAVDKKEACNQADKIKKTMQGRPFIFNLGHGILPETPIEHVQAVIDTVRGT